VSRAWTVVIVLLRVWTQSSRQLARCRRPRRGRWGCGWCGRRSARGGDRHVVLVVAGGVRLEVDEVGGGEGAGAGQVDEHVLVGVGAGVGVRRRGCAGPTGAGLARVEGEGLVVAHAVAGGGLVGGLAGVLEVGLARFEVGGPQSRARRLVFWSRGRPVSARRRCRRGRSCVRRASRRRSVGGEQVGERELGEGRLGVALLGEEAEVEVDVGGELVLAGVVGGGVEVGGGGVEVAGEEVGVAAAGEGARVGGHGGEGGGVGLDRGAVVPVGDVFAAGGEGLAVAAGDGGVEALTATCRRAGGRVARAAGSVAVTISAGCAGGSTATGGCTRRRRGAARVCRSDRASGECRGGSRRRVWPVARNGERVPPGCGAVHAAPEASRECGAMHRRGAAMWAHAGTPGDGVSGVGPAVRRCAGPRARRDAGSGA
jgi:hypothetical protein